jgi:hypothetical protein
MSQLQKKISRIQRREGPGIGFGLAAREQPRAMLLAALAADAGAGTAALDAGADLVIVQASDGAAAAKIVEGVAGDKACVGARLNGLSGADADALAKAGCDFVISTLDGTDSSAVDTERMGQVVVAGAGIDDTTLRALAPLGLDALFTELPTGAMKLVDQLALMRLASFASAPLVVTIDPGASVADLRVLRDSGVAVVVAPAGASPSQITGIGDNLKAVPAPRKAKREGGDIALVPATANAHAHDEEEDDDDDDE